MIVTRHHMLILLICLWLAPSVVGAQPLGIAVKDDFSDNSGRWRVGQWNNGIVTISNGKYVIDRRSIMNEWFLESGWFVDYDADFDIDLRVRQVSGAPDQGFGISWAANTAQNANGVLVTSAGNYKGTHGVMDANATCYHGRRRKKYHRWEHGSHLRCESVDLA